MIVFWLRPRRLRSRLGILSSGSVRRGAPVMTCGMVRSGRYELRHATLLDLIGLAWGMPGERVIGGPDWLGKERFDIGAQVPRGAEASVIGPMLQALLEDRSPHAAASGALWARIESGEARGMLAAHAVTTIHYLLCQHLKEPRAKRAVGSLLSTFGIGPVNEKVLADALLSDSVVYGDAVMAAAAFHAGCDLVVTRDPRGFRGSTLKVIAPDAATALIARSQD